MEKFDRALQQYILTALLDSYPSGLSDEKYAAFRDRFATYEIRTANIMYLYEHGLISIRFDTQDEFYTKDMKITAKGIDFMLADGGLSAILNVQTVKLHRETVVVLEDLIAISNLSEPEKEKAKSTLNEMSTEAIKTVISTVTATGLSMLLGK